MSADDEDRPAKDIEKDMGNEAGSMQRDLDKLGDHVEEARKKAEHTRQHADLPGDDAVETVAGDAGERSTSSEDPASAVDDPEKAED